jgi:hypothetical protein
MAKKRAYVDATLQVAALSEIFTQDVEDMKELIKSEQSDNMTVEEAAGMKINFGKYKGQALGEIYKQHPDYVQWFFDKGTDPIVKKAFEILSSAAKEAHEKKKPEVSYEGTPFSDAAIQAASQEAPPKAEPGTNNK